MKRTSTINLLFAFLLSNFLGLPIFANTATDTLIGHHFNQHLKNMEVEDAFVVKDLIPGNRYSLLFSIDDDESCLPNLTMDLPFLKVRETAWQVILEFRATKSIETIRFISPCKAVKSSNYFISSRCDSCPYEANIKRNQVSIQATQGVDPDFLVKDVFIGGGCFEVENVTFKGPDIARGTFTKGSASINMEDGVILSTGDVRNSHGPNEQTNVSTEFSAAAGQGDNDLSTLLRRMGSASTLVRDVAVLEFDFTPTTEELSFQYAFASDEYCDFVDSDFNDAFGFFISGPGINGPFENRGINIALVPGTNDFVAINSVNYRSNKEYYNNNRPLFQGQNGSGCRFFELFDSPAAKNDIEYDGFTEVFTARATVIPCETYHIKLAVGDVQDKKYDSAVFLKANSFNLGDPAELGTEVTDAVFPDSNIVYESCQESFFVFKRTEDSDISRPQKVEFVISPNSTATPYDDYSPITSPVIIPAGKDSIKVPMLIYKDDINEGNESIIFELETACTCENIETELIIAEPVEFEVNLANVSTCDGGIINLAPDIEGGIGELTYEWSTNATTATIEETVNGETTYMVTVTDQCDISQEAEVTVTIEEPVATLSGAVLVCNGERDGEIEVNFTGSGPFSLEYEIDGETKNISNIEESTFLLPVEAAGTYKAISMEANVCDGSASGEAEFVVTEVEAVFAFSNPNCFNTTDGFIAVDMDEDEATYTYDWNTGADDATIENLEAGIYSVLVTNELGCSDTKEIELVAPSEITTKITANGIANCYNPNGGSIELEVEGGSPGYTFDWNNGLSGNQNPTDLEGGIYKVNIEDANGCVINASVEVSSDLTPPVANAQVNEIISCINDEVTLETVGTSVGSDFSYSWLKSDNMGIATGEFYTTQNPTVNSGGTYTLEVLNNENGCTATTAVVVTANVDPPAMNILAPEELNCKLEMVELTGQITQKMDDYSINWTSNDGNFASDRSSLTPSIDAPGTYELEITNNENGCVNQMSVAVIQNIKTPEVKVETPSELTCDRNAVSLKTDVEMSDGDYNFAWSTINGSFLENRNTLNPIVNEAGTYTLKVTDIHNFCETDIEAKVVIDTITPTVNAGESFVFTCSQTSVTLNGSGSEGNNFTHQWSTEDGFILGGANSLSPLVNIAGSYTLKIENTETGCEGNSTVLLEDDANRPTAIVAAPPAITCSNKTVQLDASNSTNGNNIVYSWTSTDGSIVQGDQSTRPFVDEPGTYFFVVTDNSNDCEAKQVVTVELDTVAPVASITAPEVLNCQENEVQIDGSGSSGQNEIYNWTTEGGNFVSNTNIASPTINAPGTYTVGVTNTTNGCSAQVSLIITEEVPERMDVELGQPLCYGDRGRASIMAVTGGVGPYEYSIDGGNNFYNDPRFAQLTPGFYNVLIKDQNDCRLEEVIQIEQPDELSIKLDGQIKIDLGDSIELNVLTNIPENEVAEVIWSDVSNLSCEDCLNPIAKPYQSTDLQLNIIDQNGCEASATMVLLVDETPHIFVPNVFSPNSENGNEKLTIFAKSSMVQEIRNFQVYTRWGEVVYEQRNFSPNDPSMGWDGRFNNRTMKPAVFIYRAEVRLISGRDVEVKGDFSLME